MDINQVFETLDDLDNKKSKINSAREQLSEKKKSLLGNQTVSFEDIDSFLSNNLESLEKLEKMEKAINSLQEKYNSDFSEAKAVTFEYIFKETKQRMETKKIYKQYRKKDTLSWVNASDYFGKRLILHTRFDVKKVEEDCGCFIQWN